MAIRFLLLLFIVFFDLFEIGIDNIIFSTGRSCLGRVSTGVCVGLLLIGLGLWAGWAEAGVIDVRAGLPVAASSMSTVPPRESVA